MIHHGSLARWLSQCSFLRLWRRYAVNVGDGVAWRLETPAHVTNRSGLVAHLQPVAWEIVIANQAAKPMACRTA